MGGRQDAWLDAELGPVRPYALTHGRVTPTHQLERESLVQASTSPPAGDMPTYYTRVLAICAEGPRTIAEIAGRLDTLLQVVKVWVSDLLDSRHLAVPPPPALTSAASDRDVLIAVRNALTRQMEKEHNAPPARSALAGGLT